MRRFLISIMVVAAAVALVVAVGGATGAPQPSKDKVLKQETPAQLQAQANAPSQGTVGLSVQAQRVSPEQVLSDAAQPGAVVEKAAGLTPQQATGADASPNLAVASSAGSFAAAAAAETAVYCWSYTFSNRWGTWPQFQDLFDNRDWCGHYGGAQTYRVDHVNGGTFTCDWNQAYGYLRSGGNGTTWSVVRSGAHYSCPSGIPWLTYHFDRWMETASNTWGSVAYNAFS